jgi:AcrR family transcriptional regulator
VARPSLVAEEISEFRRRAVAAAMGLFAEQGYEAVTMRSLGAALGVSAMTPYRYLAGKEELFVLVRAEAFRRFADALEAALEKTPRDEPMARLVELKRAYIAFALAQPDAYRIMFELRGGGAAPGPASDELEIESRRAFACLRRSVVEAVEHGQLHGDPLTLAHLFWASTHGLISLHFAGQLEAGRSIHVLAREQWEFGALSLPQAAGSVKLSVRRPKSKTQKSKKSKRAHPRASK